jgi:23S rRNA (adenine2503-C2)-methyltransferase
LCISRFQNEVFRRKNRWSEEKQIQSFKNRLEKSRINVTIRREMGRDIDGACGQLRRSFMN